MIKPMLDPELYADCRKALKVRLAPGLEIGCQVTFADRKLPGRWVYTGDSLVQPGVWERRERVDYGVRPAM